jgi:hypothetical protein
MEQFTEVALVVKCFIILVLRIGMIVIASYGISDSARLPVGRNCGALINEWNIAGPRKMSGESSKCRMPLRTNKTNQPTDRLRVERRYSRHYLNKKACFSVRDFSDGSQCVFQYDSPFYYSSVRIY